MSQFFDDLARTLATPMPRRRAVRVLGGALVAAAVPGVPNPPRALAGARRSTVVSSVCEKKCSGASPVPCICKGPTHGCFETCGVAGSTCCCLKGADGKNAGAVACPPCTRCGDPRKGESNCPLIAGVPCGGKCCAKDELCFSSGEFKKCCPQASSPCSRSSRRRAGERGRAKAPPRAALRVRRAAPTTSAPPAAGRSSSARTAVAPARRARSAARSAARRPETRRAAETRSAARRVRSAAGSAAARRTKPAATGRTVAGRARSASGARAARPRARSAERRAVRTGGASRPARRSAARPSPRSAATTSIPSAGTTCRSASARCVSEECASDGRRALRRRRPRPRGTIATRASRRASAAARMRSPTAAARTRAASSAYTQPSAQAEPVGG